MDEKLRNSEFVFVNNAPTIAIAMIVASIYAILIIGAEIIGALGGAIPGVICDAIIILILLADYATLDKQVSYRRLLPALMLLPLLRLLSLTVPLREIPQLYWYAMIGIPLLLAAAVAAHALDLSWGDLGLRLPPSRSPFSWLYQATITMTGVPLSLAAFWLVPRPQPIPTPLAGRDIILAPIILFLFTGFAEELIFRGILQQTARQALGPFSFIYSSALFVAMYVGSLSPGYVIFIGLVGLFFGWCANRTGSLWGVVLAHSLLNIGMLLIWPVVL